MPDAAAYDLLAGCTGFVYAIAHVRGGGEMGRHWYDDGKLEHKQHTFDDFIACARHLVEAGWTTPDRIVAEGAFEVVSNGFDVVLDSTLTRLRRRSPGLNKSSHLPALSSMAMYSAAVRPV